MDIKKKINYNVKMIKNKKFNKINALLLGQCPDFKSLNYIGFLDIISRFCLLTINRQIPEKLVKNIMFLKLVKNIKNNS